MVEHFLTVVLAYMNHVQDNAERIAPCHHQV
jgi:hypothetical protein